VPACSSLDIEAILRALGAHGVDYIVVGGVCAVLSGAPVATFDLDVVHSRTRENVQRLLAALKELKACYRTNPEKSLKPTESHLSSAGHQLLMIRFGPLDVLGLIGAGREYQDLLPHTKDLRGLAILRRVLAEKAH
jgi:hypothetical protein